jgi:putative hydrolase of the HAD superfamily
LVQINAVIFDLDNVLFDERDYINAAYRNIAVYLAKCYGLSEAEIYQKLLDDLEKKTSVYPHLFDDLLAYLGLDPVTIPQILNIYASTNPHLELYPDAEHLLIALKDRKIKLGLVTNGIVETQKNKVRLLGVEKYFDVIVYARELGRENEKPNPEAYRVTLEALRSKPEETVCIGDNPHTDFYGAKKLGLQTVRLLNGEFKDIRLSQEHEADLTVRSLEEFSKILAQSS